MRRRVNRSKRWVIKQIDKLLEENLNPEYFYTLRETRDTLGFQCRGFFRLPFKRWNTCDGRKTLTDLLLDYENENPKPLSFQLPRQESRIIDEARMRLQSNPSVATNTRRRASFVRELADQIDIFREGDVPNRELLERLDSKAFHGKRTHLARLFAFLDNPEEWNRWRRRSRETPDLRGAPLGELEGGLIDLRSIDLSGARLCKADLSAAYVRTTDLSKADLRGCWLRHCDLSYADLHGAKLNGAYLVHTVLTGADLQGADLRGSYLIGTSMNQADLRGADLRGAFVWGVSVWGICVDKKTRQDGLLIDPYLEPLDYSGISLKDPPKIKEGIYVDDLEVSHFISMLGENPQIGSVINAAADRIVLLLGRFSDEEREVLDELREALPSFGYVPVVFDFDEPKNRDTIETVAILAGISNFVIANLSQPRSTPLESHLVIPSTAVPFVPVIREGERPFSMFTALQRKYPWVLPVVKYRTAGGLVSRLKKDIIEPAEREAHRIRKLKHPTE